jgi:transposase
MGTQSAAALTETRGGLAPAGPHLYVGIDIGRRAHAVAAIPQARMENDTWERAQARRIPTTVQGFKELTELLAATGVTPDLVRIGCEPTGGWYGLTAAAWLERHSYEVSWLQNWAIHDERALIIGKQTKTDALDARLIARLLYERDYMGRRRGFLHRPPRSCDALRMLVRNRANLVQQRTRYRLQLTAIEDVVFPELKEFFKTSITGTAARMLLKAFPTPSDLAEASAEALREVLVVRGRVRNLSWPALSAAHFLELQQPGATASSPSSTPRTGCSASWTVSTSRSPAWRRRSRSRLTPGPRMNAR